MLSQTSKFKFVNVDGKKYSIRHLPHAKNSVVKKTTEKAWLAGLNLVPICWAMPT